jgi:type II restriction/modification system DNA methylase subunit YeeA
MNKTALKNFAVWARNKLIADITYKAGLMGIAEDGIKAALPQSTEDTEFYDIGTKEPYLIVGEAVKQRRRLVELINRKTESSDYKTAFHSVVEEVAYTWFNRLIAIRFMEVNDYLPSHIRVLSSESADKLEPDLVTTPFDADLELTEAEKAEIIRLKNDNQVDALFRMLFIKQCNTMNALLPKLFEKTADYSELLLNVSVTDQDGVVYHLVHDIPEDDFNIEKGGQVEIIGWLYQYYNTEPKDETFALLKKNVKITKERIPSATQLFTPDWIVRYMVENSLGRLWLEGHPDDSLKSGWKYYLDEAKQEPEVQAQLDKIREEYKTIKPEDIKVIDPCMGSGHILVYAFDVLMQIYETAGYSQRDAAKSILEHNLYGLDIDDRAFQIAYFAVMMKARQYNRFILNSETVCHVYSIQESNGFNPDYLKLLDSDDLKATAEKLIDVFTDAKEYGSILNVDIPLPELEALRQRIDEISKVHYGNFFDSVRQSGIITLLVPVVQQAIVMAQKYDVVVTNPPYMGSSGMDNRLLIYTREYYPNSKLDLFAVFIEKCMNLTQKYRFMALITQQSWMFLTSFEKFRNSILNFDVTNMAHQGARAFEEISGEVVQTTAFVLRNSDLPDYHAVYIRLVSYGSQRNKELAFLKRKDVSIVAKIRYRQIPDSIIIYWISDTTVQIFKDSLLENYIEIKQGAATSDNNRFLRLWFEVSVLKIGFSLNKEQALISEYKWFPYNKGGTAIRWFGNQDYIVNYYHDGEEMKAFHEMLNKDHPGGRLKNQDYYFRDGFTWSTLSNVFAVRYCPQGSLFDTKGSMGFCHSKSLLWYLIALLNSVIGRYWMHILAPTLDFNPISLRHIPIRICDNPKIHKNVDKCLELSIELWNLNEASWEFCVPALIQYKNSGYLHKVAENAMVCINKLQSEIKSCEKENDEIFVKLYELQNEIDIFDDSKNSIVQGWSYRDFVITLISYAIGCIFGRYSLDVRGLVYAGGEWDDSKYSSFIPDKDNVLPITDEAYFEDDIVGLFCVWLKKVYGAETLEENLDFIAQVLGNKGNTSREVIRNYFLNDFFKDHCATYSVTGSGKRPIYWLFDSGKQNGFKALIYMHRYNENTIGNLRIDYLHRMERIYESEIARMQDTIDNSANAREVTAATKRKEKLQKQIKECKGYDEKIAHLALARIAIDLDDGVKVNYEKVQTDTDGKFYQVLAKI